MSVVEVDISTEPKLEARYLIEIPVLFIDDRLAFRHRVAEDDLRKRLTRAAGTGQGPEE